MRFDEDAQLLQVRGHMGRAPVGLGPILEELVESLAVKSGELTVLRARLAHADAAMEMLLRQVAALEDLNAELAEEVDELNAELEATDEILLTATRNVDRTLGLLAERAEDNLVDWADPEPLRLVG